ncbi:hypothetical protein, partial [Thiolapillus sp.]
MISSYRIGWSGAERNHRAEMLPPTEPWRDYDSRSPFYHFRRNKPFEVTNNDSSLFRVNLYWHWLFFTHYFTDWSLEFQRRKTTKNLKK